jgi:hypothetical protein
MQPSSRRIIRSFRTGALGSACLLGSAVVAACASQALDVIRAPAVADGGGGGQTVALPDAQAGDDGESPIDAGGAPGRKRGVAYGYNSDGDLAALSAGIGWWYNWALPPDRTLVSSYEAFGVDFVPMVWGGGSLDPAKLAAQVPSGAKYLLTFNEPNFGSQSNLTPTQAAMLWPKIEAFAKTRSLKIVSPSLNYCGNNCNQMNPFTWLDQFFAACAGCQVDYIGAHWYACTVSALTMVLAQYESKYKKPIWLTEFACLDSPPITVAAEQQYMKDAVAVLEADPMVFRYSWFTGRSSQQPAVDLLGPDSGVLTPLGQQYVTLSTP